MTKSIGDVMVCDAVSSNVCTDLLYKTGCSQFNTFLYLTILESMGCSFICMVTLLYKSMKHCKGSLCSHFSVIKSLPLFHQYSVGICLYAEAHRKYHSVLYRWVIIETVIQFQRCGSVGVLLKFKSLKFAFK